MAAAPPPTRFGTLFLEDTHTMTATSYLHGDEIQRSRVALLLIDVINDLEFPEGRQLLEKGLPAARCIRELRARAEDAEIPIIYVNDNFGRWRSDFQAQVRHCLNDDVVGKPIATMLQPGPDHYFILKPRHSAFFSTALAILLEQLGTKILILTGFAGDKCIPFTANDAYLRELQLLIPGDCIASNSEEDNLQALNLMQRVLKADIGPSANLTKERLRGLACQKESDRHSQ